MTKIQEYIFNKFPEKMTVKSDKNCSRLKWMGEHISSPENRFIMGVTALASQPVIDYYNKDVDEDTRKVSCARTAAKIIAGTTTGVFIRYATIKATKKMCQVAKPGEQLKKWQKILTPSDVNAEKFHNANLHVIEKSYLNQYCNTVGTLAGLVVMLYTNFAWDLPLTKFFTNVFTTQLDKKQNNNTKALEGGQK